jgi:dolichol kinase
MGIKSDGASASSNDLKEGSDSPKEVDQIQKMQKQAFEALDKEYESARLTTHINKGSRPPAIHQHYWNFILLKNSYFFIFLFSFEGKGLGFASYAASVFLNQTTQRNPPQ